jgi:hypothetical protein
VVLSCSPSVRRWRCGWGRLALVKPGLPATAFGGKGLTRAGAPAPVTPKADVVVFCATCGVTFSARRSMANSGHRTLPEYLNKEFFASFEKGTGGDGRPDDPPRRLCSQWTTAQAHCGGVGWIMLAAGFRKTRHRGLARAGWMFTLYCRGLQSRSAAQVAGGGGIAMPGTCPVMAIPHNGGDVLRDEPDIAHVMG